MQKKNLMKLKFLYVIVLSISFFGCQKKESFECVCYYANTSNYNKYIIKNTKEESEKNCKKLSNNNKNCYITIN